MKALFYIILTLITFTSCFHPNQNKPLDIGKVNLDGFVISVNNEITNDYSFLKSAKFVFLANDFPIAQLDRLFFWGDTLIVLDKKQHSIFLFRSDGTFLSKICCRGRGPGEYSNLDDITINYDTGNLLVLDRSAQKILQYSFDGSFINNYNVDYGLFERISYLNKSIFLQNSSTKFYTKKQNETYNALLNYNIKTDEFTGYLANNNSYNHLALDNKAFFYNGKDVFYNDRLSFDVYTIESTELTKLFTVFFYCNDDYYKSGADISNINNLLNSTFAYDIKDICVSSNYICFKYTKDRQSYNVVYDRQNEEVVLNNNQNTIVSAELITQKHILVYNSPEYMDNETFVTSIQSQTLKDLFETIIINNPPDDIKEVYEKIKNLDYYDNPILVFYKFSE